MSFLKNIDASLENLHVKPSFGLLILLMPQNQRPLLDGIWKDISDLLIVMLGLDWNEFG